MKNARKFVGLFVAACCVVSIAHANVDFNWSSAANAVKDQNGVNTLANRVGLLYVSSDQVVDLNTSLGLQSTYGNDQFIGSVAVGFSGRYTTSATPWGAAGAGSGSDVGLYTYMVIVNQAFSSGVTPESISAGTFYGVTSIGQIGGVNTQLQQFDIPPPQPSPQVFADSDGSVQTSIANVAVPEPSTVALMLAGLGIVAMRMRRK